MSDLVDKGCTSEGRSFFFYTIFSISSVLISYFLLIVFSAYLSKEEYAEYGLLTAIFSLVMIGFNFGHKELLFKSCSLKDDDAFISTLNSFVRLQLILLLVIFLLWPFLGDTAIISLAFICSNWLLILNHINRGSGNYVKDAISFTIQRSLWLLGCYIVISIFGNITHVDVFSVMLLSTLITLLLVVPSRIKSLSSIQIGSVFKGTPQWRVLQKYFIIEFATVAYLKFDMVMLKFLSVKSSSIAEYFLSIQLLEGAILIISPIGYFFFNRLATLAQRRDFEFSLLPKLAAKYVFFLLLIVIMGHCIWGFWGDFLLQSLFPKYLQSYKLVLFNLFVLYPIAINIILSSYLLLKHRELDYVYICLTALFISLIGNYAAIPHWGVYGAITIKIVTEFSIMLMLIYITIRQGRGKKKGYYGTI